MSRNHVRVFLPPLILMHRALDARNRERSASPHPRGLTDRAADVAHTLRHAATEFARLCTELVLHDVAGGLAYRTRNIRSAGGDPAHGGAGRVCERAERGRGTRSRRAELRREPRACRRRDGVQRARSRDGAVCENVCCWRDGCGVVCGGGFGEETETWVSDR